VKDFVHLYLQLEESNRTNDKVQALVHYFRSAPDESACWGLWFLLGNRVKRVVNTTVQREWIAEESGIPLWLVEECYTNVGDLSETISLLLPRREVGIQEPLEQIVKQTLLSLSKANDAERREIFSQVWKTFSTDQLFLWQKLQSGGFRTGVAKTLVIRALAQVAEIDPAEMAHRISGKWEPSAEVYRSFLTGTQEGLSPDAKPLLRPYPFCLAYAYELQPEQLGSPAEWQIEWKWDGIRAQLIRRDSEAMIWSRGEELISEQFPEIVELGMLLPSGTVLDGELLVWTNGVPEPFSSLQKRLGRKKVSPKMLKELPCYFMAYDVLEWKNEDVRNQSTQSRRQLLESLPGELPQGIPLQVSPIVKGDTWGELQTLRAQSRERGVEGFMLKRLTSTYGVGRTKGDWWKWKVEPYTCDCVMIYAQAGHGRRAQLHTDYTFAVWNDGELVPVMKAYSGLTDQEIEQVDKWIRKHTRERFGPVRVVDPELVFELAFEGIQRSNRHKSGVAVRFPRISRWRTDKPASEADTLQNLMSLLVEQEDE
jgi:DNA ligase-1